MFLRASVLILVITTALPAQPKIEPEAPIDYLPLSIYRSYWDEDQVSGRMFPWFGEKVAFLTLTPEIDSALMGRFVQVLDRTWAYYEQLHRGHHPEDNWNLRDKPVIAAIPDHDPMLTCDLWCARVGCNGLEVIGFYQTHVPDFIEYPNRFDLDYLEGLGLNWFPYGGRHGLFDIGYARFLGYLAY